MGPPLSGRSTPKAHVPNVMPRGQDSGFNMHKYHTLHLSTPSQEFNREEAESQRRIMDGSPPTPRSLRLDPRSAGHLSASQEELRRTSMEESSHSTPSPMSSAASSQDSLHRNAATMHHYQNPYGSLMTNTLPANTHLGKKKSVKSTLGRIFGKKDKHLRGAGGSKPGSPS